VGHAHRLQITDANGRVAAQLPGVRWVSVHHGTIAQGLFGRRTLREPVLACDWPE
jgi:hypothetical protein